MAKGKVSKTIDGDTIQLRGGKVLRLANVRAPEMGTKGGARAKRALNNLVGRKTVSYNPVGKSYGRTVANVRVGGKLVNQSMRNKGYTRRGR